MAYYRLYFLDGFGHIQQFREFEADEDAVAIEQADEWRTLAGMELWSERRKVRSWEALGPLAPSPEVRARSILRTIRLGA